jgi:D-amino-acid dehydrogenase
MDVAGGIYFPKDCQLTPDRFMAALQNQCVKLGVEFGWQTEVTGWRMQGSRIGAVVTSRGERVADEIVLCGGSWSPVVARELGLKIPIQAGKGYSLTLAKPRQLPQICAIFTEARVAVTPMDGMLRVGGTMEIAGLNEDINPVRVQGIIKAVPNYYPEFQVADFAEIQPWRGLRPCSPDGLPYLGRTAKYSNLTLATGHAMMGLSLGPISGKLVSEILGGEQPSFDLSLLSPDRYA